MHYIVTGGAGFIGSNLADTLSQNHDVVIIDNLATGRRENIEHLLDHPRVTFVEGSITDLDLLMETRWARGAGAGAPLGAPSSRARTASSTRRSSLPCRGRDVNYVNGVISSSPTIAVFPL